MFSLKGVGFGLREVLSLRPCGRLRERASPLPEVFLYYAAGWLSVSVESVSVLSLSAVDSDAMMSVTWLEPSRF